VVLDNLKEGVVVPDIYDPALNPFYRDVLTHYGCVAPPRRIQDPDRKGKVERGGEDPSIASTDSKALNQLAMLQTGDGR